MKRVDMIVVEIAVTEFNEAGQIVGGPTPAKPITMYRATTPDVWAKIDELTKQALEG